MNPAAPPTNQNDPFKIATPAMDFIRSLFHEVAAAKASDLHIESLDGRLGIRMRVDGALHFLTPPPPHLAREIIAAIKTMAHLDSSERRVPQDGRMAWQHEGRSVEFRVSTLPTHYGESMVLRLLDSQARRLTLNQLHLPPSIETAIAQALEKPHGMFLVTGPTGSGKTTTLYAFLETMRTSPRKILTVEDPVEYAIPGAMQVGVKPEIGLDFARALRSFLRHDPDVLLVGEIRDEPTARIAVQAALTGHFVLSSLHTQHAAGAIDRLIDLGIEPFIVASVVDSLLAQRLVRTICPACKKAYKPSQEELKKLALSEDFAGTIYCGAGCQACYHTGYQGRQAIFEFLKVTEALRSKITNSSHDLHAHATQEGMRSLRDEAIRLVLEGATSLEEIAPYL